MGSPVTRPWRLGARRLAGVCGGADGALVADSMLPNCRHDRGRAGGCSPRLGAWREPGGGACGWRPRRRARRFRRGTFLGSRGSRSLRSARLLPGHRRRWLAANGAAWRQRCARRQVACSSRNVLGLHLERPELGTAVLAAVVANAAGAAVGGGLGCPAPRTAERDERHHGETVGVRVCSGHWLSLRARTGARPLPGIERCAPSLEGATRDGILRLATSLIER